MPHPNVVTPRTCSRCGRGFGTLGRENTCPQCRVVPGGLPTGRPPIVRLSGREKQIVGLVQQAKTNKEIAYILCLTVGTVKEYLYHIFRKLGVTNRTELALWRGREHPDEVRVAS